MASHDRGAERAGSEDPRSAALARYLRQSAATFSMSADVTGMPTTAEAGMVLLDAAVVAESMQGDDPRIQTLSEAGLFESMPGDEAAFVEIPEVRAAIHRSVVSDVEDGGSVIARLVALAAALVDPHHEGPRP